MCRFQKILRINRFNRLTGYLLVIVDCMGTEKLWHVKMVWWINKTTYMTCRLPGNRWSQQLAICALCICSDSIPLGSIEIEGKLPPSSLLYSVYLCTHNVYLRPIQVLAFFPFDKFFSFQA